MSCNSLFVESGMVVYLPLMTRQSIVSDDHSPALSGHCLDPKKHPIFLKGIFRDMLLAYMIRFCAFTFTPEVSYADANK